MPVCYILCCRNSIRCTLIDYILCCCNLCNMVPYTLFVKVFKCSLVRNRLCIQLFVSVCVREYVVCRKCNHVKTFVDST